jgi:hypothetical protein
MIGFFKKLFGRESNPINEAIDATEDAGLWKKHKSTLMEAILGKEHPRSTRALIPFSIGGCLDLHYFPAGIAGTGIATKELSEIAGAGPSNRELSCYELVMFTRHPLNLAEAQDPDTAFGQVHDRIRQILIPLARYSSMAELNALEVLTLPADLKGVGGACLVFDEYARRSDELVTDFGLLVVIEVFREELTFALENGADTLLHLLKDAGHYPYTDLDRAPVV